MDNGGNQADGAATRAISFAQQRSWFLDQLQPGSTDYLLPMALRIRGDLDREALAGAFAAIVDRHEVLRTRYATEDGVPVQRVERRVEVTLHDVDLRDVDAADRDRAVTGLVTGELRRPVPLDAAPPWRLTLARLGADEHLLVLVVHHIAFDGWSWGVLTRELTAGYAERVGGPPADLPSLPMQYADFADWQRDQITGARLTRQLGYWRSRLAGLPPLELPTDRPRPPLRDGTGGGLRFELPPELVAEVDRFARGHRVTRFMVLVAVLEALLGRYGGQTDFGVGSPVAGRTRSEAEALIGFFVNTVVLRADLTGQPSFTELLGRVRQDALAAFSHAEAPFEQVVDELVPERDGSRNPLFQVSFSLRNARPEPTLPGLEVELLPTPLVSSPFDLTFDLNARPDGALTARIQYATALFDEVTVRRLADGYQRLLRLALDRPDVPVAALPLLSEPELRQLRAWNDTRVDYPVGDTLPDLLARQAAATPEATAVVWAAGRLTYAQLRERADRLAHRLHARGVGPESVVGVCLPRGPELVVALLGTLRAGAAYLPLDPEDPPERLAGIVADSGAAVVLADGRDAGRAFGVDVLDVRDTAGPAQPPQVALDPDHPAYLIYTSGSTGRPKGVVVSHRSIVNRLRWMQDAYRLRGDDRVLQKTPATFDVSVWEFFWPLLTGATLVLARPGGHRDPEYLAGLIAAERVTTVHFVPTMLRGFLAALPARPDGLGGLRRVLCSGEALPDDLAEEFHARIGVELHNLYGPTEAAVDVTAAPCHPGRRVTIGRPVSNTRVHVLDAELRPVPIGAVGQLCLAGVQLARGYHARPALTAERFVPDPDGAPGQRLYLTGDLARYLPDGSVEYLGRADDQVKVRGFRIEPGEVAAALTTHPAVREAVVVVHGGADAQLAAYLVPAPGAAVDADDLRAHAARVLPAHMVPAHLVTVPAIPTTPSGKLDRRALPDPVAHRLGSAAARVAPRTPTERAIASVWADLLGVADVGAHDDFFALGGNSLSLTRMTFRLRELLGVALPVADAFAARTVARLAEALAAGSHADAGPPIVPVAHDRPLPLSFAQQRLWFLDRLAPGATDYLVPLALRLRGPLDAPALLAAVDRLARRHAVLRTRYVAPDGDPAQVIDADARVPVDRIDLAATAVAEREDEALRLLHADLARPFDLAAEIPVRATLIRLADDDHLFLLTLHHIASDAWSLDLLVTELSRQYAALTGGEHAGQPVPALPVQYADYAVWQRAGAGTDTAAEQVRYWCDRLAGLPPLELPTDRRRPALRDQRGDRLAVDLPAELGRAVDELARSAGATPFMVLLAAFVALLGRYTGVRDLAVGTPSSGRDRPEVERLIGFFVNTLVLRVDLGGVSSFTDLLARVRDVTLDAQARAAVPFERIVAELAPERDPSRNPLFDVMFELQPAPGAGPDLPGVAVEQVPVAWPIAKFDLMLSVRPAGGGGLRCGFEYATALFDRDTVRRLAGQYARLLTAAVADPDRPLDGTELFTPDERARLTEGGPVVPPPAECLPELIAAQAARTPRATAVVFGDEEISYAGLLDRVGRLAAHLRAAGVRPETPVAVALRRDVDLVVALLAVHTAGGVYVPIDPDHPRRRRDHVLTDSRSAVLISRAGIQSVPAGVDIRTVLLDRDADTIAARPAEPATGVDPASAAYVVHTSGSTGRPKGVVISHEAIRNRVLWTVREHGLGPGDRVLQKTTVGFDAAMWEFLAPLVCGATVVVAADGVPRDPAAMLRAVVRHDVTVLQLVPSVLRLLVEQPALADCVTLRLVFCAGEPLPVELSERLLARLPVTLVNTYGPTECAIDVTAWRYGGDEPGEIVAIGRPLDNVRVLVLDADGRLAPVGVPGELCVAGVGLGRGYVGRGDLTADRFRPNPYPASPGERIYHTGDRVRRRADGCLEYLGRLDRQVKLNGVRVEPDEIEVVLTEHPHVAAAAVGVYPAGDQQRLVGHVVPVAGVELDVAAVRAHLAARLPEPMLPSVLRPVAALPLTASGKLDRAALPGLAGLETTADEVTAPRTPAEATVAALFAELLGRDGVDVHDDFFAVGGHSLLATRLAFRLAAVLDAEVPVAEVFARRTVARLAELVADPAGRGAGPGPVVPVPRDGELPPSPAQRRMWFLDQLEPGSTEYLVPVVLRLRGPLDAAALLGAVDDVVARHEVLRTRYVARDGVPSQVVDPPAPLGVAPLDLADRPDAQARAEAVLGEATSRPFRLDREWPLRALLVRVAADHHVLALVAHHIAVDGWSVDVLMREVGEDYRARTTGAAPPVAPPVQYADFAAWQDRWAGSGRADVELAHWRQRLAGLTSLELPTDRPRPAVRDAAGDLFPVPVPDEVAAAVTTLARRRRTTPFAVLYAAFAALLARYTGQTDIAVGAPVAGRSRPETERLVGLFTNTVVLRADVADDPSFAELVDRAGREVVAAYSHQDLPFERLVDELQPERDPSRNPLFQVMVELTHASPTPLRLAGVAVERVPAPWRTAKFDLTLSFARRADGGLNGLVEYATALFDRDTVARLAGHFVRLLRDATAAPDTRLSRLELLTENERRQVLGEWNATTGPEPAGSVPELFARRAASHPDAEAVSFGTHRLSYRELDERANRLAHHLRAAGVGPERVVAVCMERGADVVVALLAVLKAGGVYVPIDPEHPAERLAFMLDDARAHLIVTTGRYADRLSATGRPLVRLDADRAAIDARPATDPGQAADPEQLAYMIYTSGSTGQPKGALIAHGSYAHHCAVIAEAYDIRPDDRVVLLSALTFDVAMDQIAATLLAGATVVVADPLFWSPAELPDRVAEHRITIMEITPAYYREVLHHVAPGDPRLRGLRLMNVGSDVVTVDDARRWAATGLPGRFLVNYGPTEATVTCLLHPVARVPAEARGAAALPIGRPVPGTRAYVLDRHGNPVPAGVPGELHLGGVRLARGYHRRPALTADRFVPDPFGDVPGGRLYRTGDLVRQLPDGTVEFLGRIDQQVKLRGFRIELGEIEAVLARHPAVRAVAVVAPEVRPGDRCLVAYLVPHGDRLPELAQLRGYVTERLPDYMCPAVWMTLAELPLTPSKKVDRKALPAPTVDRAELERPHVAPRDATEEIVAGVWAEALGVDQLGIHDDVFLLGAHSLLVTRVLARLCGVFGVDVPLRSLFEATTVAALAGVVREAVEAEIDGLSDDEVAELLALPSDR